jgi:hypothetical protein
MTRNPWRKRALAIGSVIGLLALSTTLGAEEKKARPAAATPPPPQRVVPRSADAIAYLFHGEFYNANGEKIAKPSPEAIKAFRDAKPRARAVANPRNQAKYCADCLAAGVPEPPALGSGKWESKGTVDKKFTSEDVKDIMVYESTSPPGVCVALPRGDGADIALLGVICQSKESGKACFWDNIDSDSGNRITESDVKDFDVAKFQNGDQLEEDCTECHRGDNVYLVHDELDQIPSRDPGKRYAPMPTGAHTNGDFWSNPGRKRKNDPGDKNLMRADGCGMCHTMPAMSQGYCDNVLSPAISRGVMPPSGLLDDTDRDSLTCRDVCLLHYECVKNSADGLPDQAASDVCDCDNTWWPELSKIPPEASTD